ncbi:MAG: M48 family metallopeptidase [Phycisphaeraceae bacterium]
MGNFFYNLGRGVRAGAQKGKWIWQSLTGNEEEALKAEQDAGKEMALAFEQDAEIEDDERIVKLIDEVGSRLTGRVANKLRKFTFKCVAVEEPNAFALPGGFIFVTRALIDLCAGEGQGPGAKGQGEENQQKMSPSAIPDPHPPGPWPLAPGPSLPDELAFILGHEMGHVIKGHAWSRMTNAAVVNAATKAVRVGGIIGKLLVGAGAKAMHGTYSQDQELEADELGFRLARAAGYDPKACVQMMQRLQARSPGNVEGSLGEYFATHPPFDVRIGHLRKLM